jgi:uncharacterized HAD superfamily protein
MRLGFDIDDTLLNLREHAFRIYNLKLGLNVPAAEFHALTTIPIHAAFGFTHEQGKELWNTHRDEIYYSAPPFPDAVEVLQELVRVGHEVYYVTARALGHCARTKNAMIALGFPVQDDRFFCGMGDTEKVHVIRKLELDYYFDDKPAVLETLHTLDLKVFARDIGYNRHLDLPRITHWNELLELLRS